MREGPVPAPAETAFIDGGRRSAVSGRSRRPRSLLCCARRDQAPRRSTPSSRDDDDAFASRWLVPRLPRWRKVHPDAPLDVIGTDSVLDLHAGDADVAIRYATGRREPKEDIAEEFLSDSFWPICSPQLLPRLGASGALPILRNMSLSIPIGRHQT